MPKIHIKLVVAGHDCHFDIDREKEETFRRAEKEVKRLMAEVESRYAAPKEMCLATVALQLAVRAVELESNRSVDRNVEKLNEIQRMLDDHFGKL